jgi:hypothetical protein
LGYSYFVIGNTTKLGYNVNLDYNSFVKFEIKYRNVLEFRTTQGSTSQILQSHNTIQIK